MGCAICKEGYGRCSGQGEGREQAALSVKRGGMHSVPVLGQFQAKYSGHMKMVPDLGMALVGLASTISCSRL